MRKILLIGFGNLGKHYLTALSKLKMNTHVHIVDIATENFSDSLTNQKNTECYIRKITVSTKIKAIPFHPDVTIVVTPAHSRLAILKELAEKGIDKKIILEKPITNCMQDLIALKSLNLQHNKIWVNTQRRSFDIYKFLKLQLNKCENLHSISMHVEEGNLNLLSNALHFIDLGEYLFSSNIKNIEFRDSFEPYSVVRKRTIDVYGAMLITLDSGNTVEIINSNNDNKRVIQLVQDELELYTIFENDRRIIGKNSSIKRFEFPGVSSFSTEIVSSILFTELCDLPTLSTSLRQHELFLTVLEAIGPSYGLEVPVNFS